MVKKKNPCIGVSLFHVVVASVFIVAGIRYAISTNVKGLVTYLQHTRREILIRDILKIGIITELRCVPVI